MSVVIDHFCFSKNCFYFFSYFLLLIYFVGIITFLKVLYRIKKNKVTLPFSYRIRKSYILWKTVTLGSYINKEINIQSQFVE